MKKIEVTLKEIAIYVLRRWYVVLAVAAAVAVGYGMYSGSKSARAQAQYQKDLLAYQASLEDFNNQVALSKQKTERIEADIAAVQDYLDNSIRMSVNPYSHEVSTVTLDFDSEVSNTVLNRATNHYWMLAQEAPLESVLANVVPEAYNISYVSEAITFKRNDNDILTISAIGTSSIRPELITQALVDYLVSKKDLVTNSAGAHTFSVIDKQLQQSADVTLVNVRNIQESRLATLKRQLTDFKVDKPVAPQAVSADGSLLLGVLSGLVVGVLIVVVVYLLFLPIQYDSQVQKQLHIRYLGQLKPNTNTQDYADLLAANIAEVANDVKSVLLLASSVRTPSDIALQVVEESDALEHLTFSTGNNVQREPETVEALANADGVIFILERYHSRVRDVWADAQRVSQADKPILGYVVQ